MTSSGKLREKWPWNEEYLRIFVAVPGVIGVAAALVLYPVAGFHSLWFLLAIPFGLLFRLTFGIAGARVAALKESVSPRDGEIAEGLLVTGNVQSPGLAVLGSSDLTLVPIVGERRTIPLSELRVLRQGRCLPGKYVWGKLAFILSKHDGKRIAFAIPESVGRRWSARLDGAAG